MITFHDCIVSGKVQSVNLRHIGLNNCITPSLTLSQQKSVNISYSNVIRSPRIWLNFINKLKTSPEDLLSQKQTLILDKPIKATFHFDQYQSELTGLIHGRTSSTIHSPEYFLSIDQKLLLNISLHVIFNGRKDQKIHIANCIFHSITLKGSATGKINIENSCVNCLYIHEFSSSEDTLFYNLNPYKSEAKIEIHKSKMDNAWFDNINFNSYKTVFYRSRLAKASFTSCEFPEENISFKNFISQPNIHYPNEISENFHKDQYETYLQLSTSLLATGNYYEAQKAQAISKKALRKIPSVPYWDKFILHINEKTNKHGLSIKHPFILLLASSIFLYLAYLLSSGRVFNSFIFDWNLVGNYFVFLDPTHKNNFLISKEYQTFWTLSIDFFAKLLSGFFIYQLIVSFRKYGRK